MSTIEQDLLYTASHEWVRKNKDHSVHVGITHHAQELLGELVFVELPEIGQKIAKDDEICVVESVKAASDVYSPLSGEVVAINEELLDNPDIVNKSPYFDGWLFQIMPDSPEELDELLSPDQYQEQIEVA